MKEDSDERPINSRTHVGISVGLFVSMAVGVILFLYSEIQAVKASVKSEIKSVRDEIEGKRSYFEARLDTKADRSDASDRFTGTDAKDLKESFGQRFSDQKEINRLQHEALQRQQDHYADDLRNHGHNHGDIIHDDNH